MQITLFDGKFQRDYFLVPTKISADIYRAMIEGERDWGDPSLMTTFTAWVNEYAQKNVPGYTQTVVINYPADEYVPSSFEAFDTLNISVMGWWQPGWDTAVFASRTNFSDMKHMFNLVSDVDGYIDADDPFDLEDDVLPDFDDLSGRDQMLNIMRGLVHKLKASCTIGSNWVIVYSGDRLLHVVYACEERLGRDPYLVEELFSAQKYGPLYAQAVTEFVQDVRRLSLAILGASKQGQALVDAFYNGGEAQIFPEMPKVNPNTIFGPPPDSKDAVQLTMIWQEFLNLPTPVQDDGGF